MRFAIVQNKHSLNKPPFCVFHISGIPKVVVFNPQNQPFNKKKKSISDCQFKLTPLKMTLHVLALNCCCTILKQSRKLFTAKNNEPHLSNWHSASSAKSTISAKFHGDTVGQKAYIKWQVLLHKIVQHC